ncbi:MAG: hypothetical protein ACK6CE_18065, partial [Planctomycetota bacterium]
VQSVLLRPKMYTVTGSLSELLAFFNGCLRPGINETRDDGSVQSLFLWLNEQLGIESMFVLPKQIYNAAIAHFGNEKSVVLAIQKQFLEPTDLIDIASREKTGTPTALES